MGLPLHSRVHCGAATLRLSLQPAGPRLELHGPTAQHGHGGLARIAGQQLQHKPTRARRGTTVGTALALGGQDGVEGPAVLCPHGYVTKGKAKPHRAPAFFAANGETLDSTG